MNTNIAVNPCARRSRLPAVGLLATLLFGPSLPAKAEPPPRVDPSLYRVVSEIEGLERPWSLAFLPDGRRLLTEAVGRLRVVGADGALDPAPVRGLPPIYTAGQGGLMDVAVDPDFAETGRIFLTFLHGDAEANNVRLVSARLRDGALDDLRVLFTATPKAGGSNHGSRIAFLPDGTLALSLGDGFDRREDAQDPANTLGKIVRLGRDGSIPADNPLAARPGAAPEILTLGHRNVQGIALDPSDGTLLVAEHGPRGGDELNRLVPGRNYGWPLVSGGLDYSFARVTPFASLPGFEAPLLEWTPSIAPAGLAVYGGDLFPQWRGALLVPALAEKTVRLVHRQGGRITGQELLLAELGERMRDVRVAPDGSIQVLTDGETGRLLRLVPPS
ncbi:PQQ-dependent sugar dehydrogenase [Aureimonas flava]|uniref:PQQ-dependent sugar dehydrogenase n=1 Tax=Aureimonas flava TaxID=2320271 RepID=A0A3A1WR77_9HYPH|nr:PQQ-dependent sugar dehydrogenase [Aureimonas flava]RIY00278.1 PQQ-dependent sugar dehydrogenase [Aureimonas flava]